MGGACVLLFLRACEAHGARRWLLPPPPPPIADRAADGRGADGNGEYARTTYPLQDDAADGAAGVLDLLLLVLHDVAAACVF